MKPQRLAVVIACLLALVVSGGTNDGFFMSQKPAGGSLPEATAPASATNVPALGLGNPQDRKWIEYYYRHRALQEATGVLLRIATSAKDDEDSQATAHFFATVFRVDPARIAPVKAEAAKAKDAARAFLQRVVSDAATEGVARLKDRKDLRLLWAEYLATGDMGRIDAILSAFDESASDQAEALESAGRRLLLDAVPFHAEVYSAVMEAAQLAEGKRLERVQALADELKERFGDPVGIPLSRARNLADQRDCRKARALIEGALRIFPDSARAQSVLAYVAELDGKLEEARLAASRAVAIYPTSANYHYTLGRICFFLKDYKAAASSYEKAIELKYSFHAVWHAVARAYQEGGNQKEAVRCFKKYLQLEPHGPNESLVKAYLASVNQPVYEDPRDIVSMLHRADYAALEKQLTTILRENKRNELGRSELSAAYDYLCDYPSGRFEFEKFLTRFKRWASLCLESHFAHAAYGEVLTTYAWQARGGGWSPTVTSEGWRLFEERLQKARAELERAYELNPADPMPPAFLITVARGLGLDREEMEKQFRRGITASPDEYELFARKLEYLMPKWHGTEEEMLAFAREAAKNAPADSLTPRILVKAHWELFLRNNNDRRYFQKPEVWREMKEVYTKECNQFPKATERRNWFALTAFYAGDYETAERQLQIIGEDWSASVWHDRSFFDQVRAETRNKVGR